MEKYRLYPCSALKEETPCEKVSEVDLLIVCKPEPIERRKQPSQPLLVLCTDGHVNAGFGMADLVLEVIQPVARLRKARCPFPKFITS